MRRRIIEKESDNFLSHTYTKFGGINNITESVRSGKPDEIVMLTSASNADIDEIGMIYRRKGYSLAKAGDYKNAYSDGKYIYAVKDGDLVMLDNFTETTLLADVGTTEASFIHIADVVYFTNGIIIKSIQDRTVYTPADPAMVNKAVIPPGNILKVFNGRLLIVDNNILYISDGGGAFDRYDMESGVWPFPITIDMVIPVDDGVFISADMIYFLSGLAPEDWEQIPKSDEKAIKGTDDRKENIPVLGEFYSVAVSFTTNKGICVVGNGGKFVSLTEAKYTMSDAVVGCGQIRSFKGAYQYIASLKA